MEEYSPGTYDLSGYLQKPLSKKSSLEENALAAQAGYENRVAQVTGCSCFAQQRTGGRVPWTTLTSIWALLKGLTHNVVKQLR